MDLDLVHEFLSHPEKFYFSDDDNDTAYDDDNIKWILWYWIDDNKGL